MLGHGKPILAAVTAFQRETRHKTTGNPSRDAHYPEVLSITCILRECCRYANFRLQPEEAFHAFDAHCRDCDDPRAVRIFR
jgi:hypothetical protein